MDNAGSTRKNSVTRNGSWDTDGFDQRLHSNHGKNWKDKQNGGQQGQQPVKRVQDLGLGLADPEQAARIQQEREQQQQQSWPFESSPCRFHGGKNTKAGHGDGNASKRAQAAAAMNEELFDASFADKMSLDDNHNNDQQQQQQQFTDVMDVDPPEPHQQQQSYAKTTGAPGDEEEDDDASKSSSSASDDDSSEDSFGCDDDDSGDNPSAVAPNPYMTNSSNSNSNHRMSSGGVDAKWNQVAHGNGSAEEPQAQQAVQPQPQRKQRRPLNLFRRSESAKNVTAAEKEELKKPVMRRNKSNDELGMHSYHGSRTIPNQQQQQQQQQQPKTSKRSSFFGSRRSSEAKQQAPEQPPQGATGRGGGGAAGGGGGSSRPVRRGLNAPVRTKSSDGLDTMANSASSGNTRRGGRRSSVDELSASSVHGTQPSVSRIRSKSTERRSNQMAAASVHGTRANKESASAAQKDHAATSGGNNKDNSSRRGRLTRAMSRENVMPPEQYAPRRGTRPGSTTGQQQSQPQQQSQQQGDSQQQPSEQTAAQAYQSPARGIRLRRDTGKTRRKMQRTNSSGSLHGTPRSATPNSKKKAAAVHGGSGADPTLSSSENANRRSVSRERSSHGRSTSRERSVRRNRSIDNGSSGSGGSSSHRRSLDAGGSSHGRRSSDAHKSSNGSSSGGGGGSRRGSSGSGEAKRDLLVLLRDQKSIQQKDLMDKENRRLLHFLMYEHKMGLGMQDIQKSIRQEQQQAGGVEAANNRRNQARHYMEA